MPLPRCTMDWSVRMAFPAPMHMFTQCLKMEIEGDREMLHISVKLLTDEHLEFLSLKDFCTGSSESIHVKMPRCWKSHVAAQMDYSMH